MESPHLRESDATDEVPLGLSFFRTAIEDEDLPELSIPRTFFCRSLVSHTNFRGSDLAESFMCRNDFVRVDFSSADLSRANLRAAIFDQVSFAGRICQEQTYAGATSHVRLHRRQDGGRPAYGGR